MVASFKTPKTPRAVMEAARGEQCTVNIAGVCSYDQDSTVAAHLPDASGGSSRLTGPLSIAFACHQCHDVIDGRRQLEMDRADREFYLRRAQNRTLNRLILKGVVMVKGL